MPGMSGLRVCEELRKKSTVPILFLTAKAQESDKLVGLTAGGDDYLGKPFSFAELSARVRALLRRYTVYRGKGESAAAPERRTLCAHGVKLSLDCNRVWVDGQEVNLTETEYGILRAGGVRGGVARTLLLHLQRHRDGTYPQPAHKDRGRPPEPPQGLHRVGQRLSLCPGWRRRP